MIIPSLADVLLAHPVSAGQPITFGRSPLVSRICNADDFLSAGYRHWCQRIHEIPRFHRKQWEYCFIAQVLFERGLLSAGRRGLGFGVGREPLPALFAAHGADITASDAPEEVAREGGWERTDQWSGGLAQLAYPAIRDPATFARGVRFETFDMRTIPPRHAARYDFTWSSCVFEHLGSVAAGFEFLKAQARCLVWGGVGVHTTELRLLVEEPSVEAPGTVLFCRRDLERLSGLLAEEGFRLVPIHWQLGDSLHERYIDAWPYCSEPHLRLQIAGHYATSIGLIIVRQAAP